MMNLSLEMGQNFDLRRAARRGLRVDRGGDGHHDRRRLAIAHRRLGVVLDDGDAAVILRLTVGGLLAVAGVVVEVVLQVGDVVVVLLCVSVDYDACLIKPAYISYNPFSILSLVARVEPSESRMSSS